MDFIIDFPAGQDLVILQLADIQLQTLKGARSTERRSQLSGAYFSGFPAGKRNDHEFRAWRYVEEAIDKVQPDLILLTGDNVFGETDDSGKDWLEFVTRMDSYGIPWCPVFGNHDNESGKGVLWQISQLEQSEYCIFKQGSVSGNSNYNLLIRQGGEAKYLLYMMDSNGCKTRSDVAGAGLMPDNPDIDLIVQDAGFCDDQLEWMKASGNSVRRAYGEVPSLIFFPPSSSSTSPTTPPGSASRTLTGTKWSSSPSTPITRETRALPWNPWAATTTAPSGATPRRSGASVCSWDTATRWPPPSTARASA